MFTPEQLQALSSNESEQTFEFNIPTGDDSDSLWQDMVNLRPQVDGRYVFSKFRGGSSVLESHSGTTQTDSFTVDLGTGSLKYYIIVDNAGNVFLKPDGGSKYQIFSGFTPGAHIDFHVNGKFLYAFEHGGVNKKYHDINSGGSYEFHANDPTRILSATLEGTGNYEEDNVFGFNEGHAAIIIPARLDAEGLDIDEISPFIARINQVRNSTITYKNADIFANLQTVSTGEETDNILPYNADLEDLVGTTLREQITLYRAYIIVDMLDDGSTMIPCRPEIVSVNESVITSSRPSRVKLTFTQAPGNVEKRFLLATRWQYTLERVFEPSSERHPNSPFYICGDISKRRTEYTDTTPDRLLIRPLSEIIPVRGGVPLLLHHNSLRFNTSTSFKGSLITGDYTITRPVPVTHNQKSQVGNCFVPNESGSALGEVKIAFEYTDGKKSNVVNTGVQCTNATEVVVEALESTSPRAVIEVGAITFDISSGEDRGLDSLPGEDPPPGGDDDTRDYRGGFVFIRFPNDQTIRVDFGSTYNSITLSEKIISAINSQISGYSAVPSSTIASGNYQFVVEKDEKGASGNGERLEINYTSEFVKINRSSVGLLSVPLTGGLDGDAAVERAKSKIQIYNLNALVAKVFVIIDSKLYREISASDSYFHGHPLRLLSDSAEIANLPDFTAFGSDEIQTEVTISGGLTLSIPFQQFRIDRQYRAFSPYAIQKLVPLQFDSDRTRLRYQLMAVTDSDVQLGYIQGQADTFSADFEPVDDSVEITDPGRIKKVNGQTFVRTEQGLHRFTGRGGLELILPRDRYSVLEHPLYDVAFNTRHGEYWFCFGQPIVLVFKNGLWYKMRYPVNVFSLQFAFGVMSIGVGNGLFQTDIETSFTDVIGSAHEIKADLVSRHLSDETTQLKMFDFEVQGKGATAEMFIDSQPERYEGNVASGWTKVFDTNYSYTSQPLAVNGAIWQINERAIMPRVKVEAVTNQAGAFISKSLLKGYITESRNVAKL